MIDRGRKEPGYPGSADPDIPGILFDIKEFSTNDGPGVRETVFLKGCPLRCVWCHNPEGLRSAPQLMVQAGACTDCGSCRRVCENETCTACGKCTGVCPLRLRRICGERITAGELAARLARNAPIYSEMGGGVTVSGGEPLAQPDFLKAACDLMPGVHKVLETSGFAAPDVFAACTERFDLVLIDIKHMDPARHRQLTGADNSRILANIQALDASGIPYIVRMPIIPGCSDEAANLDAAASFLRALRHLDTVELLPSNVMAGSKYISLGLEEPRHTEHAPGQLLHSAAERLAGLPVRILE